MFVLYAKILPSSICSTTLFSKPLKWESIFQIQIKGALFAIFGVNWRKQINFYLFNAVYVWLWMRQSGEGLCLISTIKFNWFNPYWFKAY